MRPIHIGDIDVNYQQSVDKKAKEICKFKTDLHLYQLASTFEKDKSEDNKKELKDAKEKYKNEAAKIYKKAAKPLKERIGNYCCYCERKFSNGLAVEHKCPKDLKENWNLIIKWNNFLISCTTCNSKKNTCRVVKDNISSFVFPDTDDTYHCVSYEEANNFRATLNNRFIHDPYLRARVQRTIDMLKLNEHEDINDSATRCFEKRANAYMARLLKKSVERDGASEHLELIKGNVQLGGCWSIWMHAFEDIPAVRETILYALPNTAIEYFIDDYWKHERYFKEQHTLEEYYYRLLIVIHIRTAYIAGHLKKLRPIQKEGIVNWTINFTKGVISKTTFTAEQRKGINAAIMILNNA